MSDLPLNIFDEYTSEALMICDQLLNGALFYRLRGARILIEQWRIHDNTVGPQSGLGYRPPVSESIVPMNQRPTML